ncbi:CRISPR-associated endonuclease Cas2 [Patescibacteria group bacterium]|nr:CRISPR-associated endonuclease Cas2 [Patescibacteria group bacterium]MBU1931193.1 CRISPR-associated endonuclease Cas2 [Patescibacteria group bacterium]
MAKLLRLRDRLLFGLAIGGDILDDLVGGGSRAYHAGKLWFWTPRNYSKKSYASLIGRMLRTNEIERIIDKGEVYFRLKGSGKKELLRRFPVLSLASKPWDGFWRLLIFDIPERKRHLRDQVRAKLNELGFAMIQRSVYISPHDFGDDLKEFFQTKGLWGEVLLMEAKQKYLGSPRDVAAKMWRLEKINSQYEQVINQLSRQFGLKDKNERTLFFKRVYNQYLAIVFKDPFLPKELLPKDWQGERARELIRKVALVI